MGGGGEIPRPRAMCCFFGECTKLEHFLLTFQLFNTDPQWCGKSQAPRLSGSQTVRLSDCQGLRLSGSQTVRLSDCQALRLSGSQTVRLSDCQGLRLSGSQTVRLSDCQALRLQSQQDGCKGHGRIPPRTDLLEHGLALGPCSFSNCVAHIHTRTHTHTAHAHIIMCVLCRVCVSGCVCVYVT